MPVFVGRTSRPTDFKFGKEGSSVNGLGGSNDGLGIAFSLMCAGSGNGIFISKFFMSSSGGVEEGVEGAEDDGGVVLEDAVGVGMYSSPSASESEDGSGIEKYEKSVDITAGAGVGRSHLETGRMEVECEGRMGGGESDEHAAAQQSPRT